MTAVDRCSQETSLGLVSIDPDHLRLIGFQRVFDNESAYAEIPRFWDEICAKYAANVYAGNAPANPCEQALMDNCIGEYGVCIDDIGGGQFRYLVAGKYTGGDVPEGMVVYEFPRSDWAVFDCIGPIPEALQSVNTRIFQEWLPGNPDYELCGNGSVEWYDCLNGEKTDPDYHSATPLFPVTNSENNGVFFIAFCSSCPPHGETFFPPSIWAILRSSAPLITSSKNAIAVA